MALSWNAIVLEMYMESKRGFCCSPNFLTEGRMIENSHVNILLYSSLFYKTIKYTYTLCFHSRQANGRKANINGRIWNSDVRHYYYVIALHLSLI